jgi:hypothetical protein
MVGRVSETARASQWACAAPPNIDAPHKTEIKPLIAKARVSSLLYIEIPKVFLTPHHGRSHQQGSNTMVVSKVIVEM